MGEVASTMLSNLYVLLIANNVLVVSPIFGICKLCLQLSALTLVSAPYSCRKTSSHAATGQLSIPTYSYPASFLPVDQNGLRQAYPFMAIPSQYVTQMPYQTQVSLLA